MRRSSENVDPYRIEDGILLDIWGIRTKNNGNLSKLPKILFTKILLFWYLGPKMRHGFLGI